MVWDDDQLFAQPGEPREGMRKGVGLIEAQDFFFWDDPYHVATHGYLDRHVAVQLFRNNDGDWFSEERIQHAPSKILETGSKIKLNSVLLNYGLFTEAERRRTFRLYKRAGKLDTFTRAFISEPTLYKYNTRRDDDWVHKAAEHLRKQALCQ